MGFLRFLNYEYQNYIASLITAYDFIYSKQYGTESSAYKDVILQNFVTIGKKNLTSIENSMFKPYFSKIKYSKILDFRTRVHLLRDKIKSMVLGKIEIYSLMFERHIDYRELVGNAVKLYAMQKKTMKEFRELFSIESKNIKLNREAIMFELCVLEKQYVSSQLKKHYHESLIDVKYRAGSVYTNDNSKNRFSFYNSSNIAIFARNNNNVFRIAKFTLNAAELLGLKKHEIFGKELSEFMPPQIAAMHDRIMLNYMNGNNNSNKKGRIRTVVKSKRNISRSVVILPKLDYLMSDDIYIGALISVRKKNHYPLLFTDIAGKIVGWNNQALKVLSDKSTLSTESLFALYPRLFMAYYPEVRRSLMSKENTTQIQYEMLDNKNLDDLSSNENELTEFNMTTVGDLRANSSKEYDVFQFQMFSKTESINEDAMDSHDEETKPLSDSKNRLLNSNWAKFKSDLKTKDILPKTFKLVAELITLQRKAILKNLTKIVRVKISLETNHYQRHATLREISLQTIQKTSNRAKQFFRLFADNNPNLLMEVLMISPEALNTIYRICGYKHQLKAIMKDYKGTKSYSTHKSSKLQSDSQISGMSQLIQNSKAIIENEGNISGVLQELNEDSVINEVAEDGDLSNSVKNTEAQQRLLHTESIYKRIEDLGANREDSPVLNVMEKANNQQTPRRYTNLDVPKKSTYFSLDPSSEVSNGEQLYTEEFVTVQLSEIRDILMLEADQTPIDNNNTKSPFGSKSIASKLKSLSFMGESTRARLSQIRDNIGYLKQTLVKEYDLSKINKIIEIVMAGMFTTYSNKSKKTFKNMTTKMIGQTGATGDIAHAGGSIQSSSYTYGNLLMSQNATLVNEAEIDFSDKDSISEIRYENTDPLKTIVQNDDPSTFFNSSSKRSVKEDLNSHQVRNRIKSSASRMKYKYCEFMLYLASTVLISILIVVKVLYDQSISQLYLYEKQINRFGNLLRPLSFVFKESVKSFVVEELQIDPELMIHKSFLYLSHNKHYLDAFSLQVRQTKEIYNSDLNTRFSFLPGIPAKDISVFGYEYTVLAEYSEAYRLLSQRGINYNGDEIYPTWEDLRNQTAILFQTLILSFEKEEKQSVVNLKNVYFYFNMNFISNCVISVCIVLIILIIGYLIHSQMKDIRDLLLKVDKAKFKLALKKLNRNTFEIDDYGNTGKREFKDIITSNLRNIDVADQGEEKNNRKNKKNIEKPKKQKQSLLTANNESRSKQAERPFLRVNQNTVSYSTFSSFKRTPKKNLKILAVWMSLLMLLVNMPNIVNFFYLTSFYSDLLGSLNSSTSLTLASSSFYMLSALNYRGMFENTTIKTNQVFDYSLLKLRSKLESFIVKAKDLNDRLLIDSFATLQVCQTSIASMAKTTNKSLQNEFCLYSSSGYSDYTWKKGLHELAFYYDKVDALGSTEQNLQTYFTSTEFIKRDLKLFYMTLTIRELNLNFMVKILDLISDSSNTSNMLLAVYVCLVVIFIAYYKLWWIRGKLKLVADLKITFLIMNDEIIDNMYIKAYFGYEIGS